MRYDSAAQTLLNHRPLTIFSGYVPFGKVRNNEINKHSLPPVTALALWGLYAARLLMRECTILLLQEKKKIIGQYSKISKISSQPAPQQDTARVCFSLSSPSFFLISSCSNCFCYTCSGKIAISFVSTSQLNKVVIKRKGKKANGRDWVYQITGDGIL